MYNVYSLGTARVKPPPPPPPLPKKRLRKDMQIRAALVSTFQKYPQIKLLMISVGENV